MQRLKRSGRVHLGSALLVALATAAVATSADEPESNRIEIEAIRQAATAYLEAVDRGDSAAMQGFWTPEGNVIDETGRTFKPHDAQRGPATGEPKINGQQRLAVRVESIRLVTPDVAIEDGTSEVSPATDGRLALGRFTAVWVKRRGKWLIDSVRESSSPVPLNQQRLQELGWMVGEWVESGDAAAIHARCSWSPDRNFLLREIRIHPKDRDAHVVTQRIGWDPVAGKIRSWVFDSDGGFGEGTWGHEGNRWRVTSTSVLPGGKRATGTTINTLVDDDNILWESLDYVVDGQAMPDLHVKLVRKGTSN